MRKVAVIGSTGSGKTTFARALAEKLGVPHVELDALHWQSGWMVSPRDEVRSQVSEALAGDGWVIDGNYGGTIGMLVLDQAEEIIWLDLPFGRTLWWLLRRTIRRIRTREPLWGTNNRETLRGSFLSRDSILWYLVKSYRRRRRGCRELVSDRPHVTLRSRQEIVRYLDDVA